jgi:gliding motility-associated-like protein
MHINFANYSRYAFSRLGATFTKEAIHTTTLNPIVLEPQVLNDQGYLNDTSSWVKIEGTFTATGNERFLTIGYFNSNVQNDTLHFQEPPVFVSTGYGYYYIDDVSVIELGHVNDCSYIPANIFSPNGDGDNDVWEFGGSSDGELTIVNRWGNPVYHSRGYSFSWDGGNCTDGVYYFTYYSDNFTKAGFIQLIR